MIDAREVLHKRVSRDLGPWVSFGFMDEAPTDEEIDAVLDTFEKEGAPLSERYEDYGESFVASDVILSLCERRGALVLHDPKWADATRAAEELAERAGLDEQARQQLHEMAADARRDAPADYDELLERYVELTDGLLDGLEWELTGDHRTDDTVELRCEREGRAIEATLAGGDEVDVEGLVGVLNRVVAETTLSSDRFTQLESWGGSGVFIFFVSQSDVDALENYFSYAVGKFRQHVGVE